MRRDACWNYLFKCFDIGIILAVLVVVDGLLQLVTDVAAQIFVAYFYLSACRVLKAESCFKYLVSHIGLALAKLLTDIWNVDTAVNVDAGDNAVLHVLRFGVLLLLNDSAAEHVGLAKLLHLLAACICGLLELLQGKHTGEINVVLQE